MNKSKVFTLMSVITTVKLSDMQFSFMRKQHVKTLSGLEEERHNCMAEECKPEKWNGLGWQRLRQSLLKEKLIDLILPLHEFPFFCMGKKTDRLNAKLVYFTSVFCQIFQRNSAYVLKHWMHVLCILTFVCLNSWELYVLEFAFRNPFT